MEPEEKAILAGLVRAIAAVPAEQWDVSDQLHLKTLLQQAILADGLSRGAKTAASEVSSLVDECGNSLAAVGQVFQKWKGSCFLDITAQVPTVSI